MIEKAWRTLGGRKFLVVVLASVLVWFGKITPTDWRWIALGYMFANVVAKIPGLKEALAEIIKGVLARCLPASGSGGVAGTAS